MTEHFTSVEFENFGPIKKAELKLTRLHALIGPNDAGKSFTLNGISSAAQLEGKPRGIAAVRTTTFSAVYEKRVTWLKEEGNEVLIPPSAATHWPQSVRKLRLDPDELRRPAALFVDGAQLVFGNERGLGLGAVLDAIFVRGAADYLEIQRQLLERFPVVEGLRLFTRDLGRVVGVRLKGGAEIDANGMSEGILYFLAFTALRYLDPVDILLVEEPENGLHPARIAEVVSVLREISKTTQVVMATHSPLVINELQPDEVTLVTRTPEEGTKFTPIKDTHNFEKRSSVYALGELWLSYADGKTEETLLKPGTK